MKRLAMGLILGVTLLAGVLPAAAQLEGQPISNGDSVTGKITNVDFDVLYSFEGKAGDVVEIEMLSVGEAGFDPYLYLTTPENNILARNDDYYDLNARIVARLPADGTYVIVATRLGERSGSGEGNFELHLQQIPVAAAGQVLEGSASYGERPPTHVIVLEQSGLYTLTYTQVRGSYYPALIVSWVNPDSNYDEDVAQLSARGLRGGSLTLELQADAIYALSVEQNPHDYSATTGDSALYTIKVEAAAE